MKIRSYLSIYQQFSSVLNYCKMEEFSNGEEMPDQTKKLPKDRYNAISKLSKVAIV